LGICAATAYNHLKRHGLAGSMPQRAKPHPLLPLLEPIKLDYVSGLTVQQVADKYASSYTSILGLLRRYAANLIRGYDTRHQFRAMPQRCANPVEHDRAVNLSYSRRNYWADPEAARRKQREWRDANPRAVREYTRAWIEKNRERVRAICRNRRALVKGAPGSHHHTDIERIHDLQGGCCAYCGCPVDLRAKGGSHVDHIHPLSRGGSNWPVNLAVTCPPCNSRKGDRTLEEFFATEGGNLNVNYEYLRHTRFLVWGDRTDETQGRCK
jgi:5-methylcytosine-specific restriction endonuclease McrA